jgi:hypothetical protein
MPISTVYRALQQIALRDYSDIVLQANILLLQTGDPHKLRIDIVDGSTLDVFISVSGRYSYHWERRLTPADDLYRHDNAPHHRWRHIATFPKHFHNGAEDHVAESTLGSDPQEALHEFLGFVRHKLLNTR